MLGHSSIETTRNYLKVLVSEVQKEMDEMEERMDRLSYNARQREQNKGKGKNYQAATNDYRDNQVLEQIIRLGHWKSNISGLYGNVLGI